tara:strand:+ start:870 stop:1112 length:243 start_codon:yes stop_codon:yes gene_type:complete
MAKAAVKEIVSGLVDSFNVVSSRPDPLIDSCTAWELGAANTAEKTVQYAYTRGLLDKSEASEALRNLGLNPASVKRWERD